MSTTEFVMARNVDPTRAGNGPTPAFATGSGGVMELSAVVTFSDATSIQIDYSTDLANWKALQTWFPLPLGANYINLGKVGPGYIRLSFGSEDFQAFINIVRARIVHEDEDCGCAENVDE